MKIGIVTFYAARNYGAVLQAYALQTYLKKVGHEPFFINYNYKFQEPSKLRRFLVWPWYWPMQLAYSIISSSHLRLFSCFRKRYLNISEDIYADYAQLQRTPPIADAYICGSDQVWNPNLYSFESDEHVSWLNFGDEDARRIAYAASFSVRDIEKDKCVKWTAFAKRFYAVSVREREGVELAKALGVDGAICVPDPTLLLAASEYSHIEGKIKVNDPPYFFSYQIGSDNKIIASKVITTVSAKLDLPCRESNPNLLTHLLLNDGLVGPDKWLSRLRNSQFTITNSFHGLIFSLIFHRPFIIMLRENETAALNSRLASLLDLVDLKHRAMTTFDQVQVERLCDEEINWSDVDSKLMRFREVGVNFINKALS